MPIEVRRQYLVRIRWRYQEAGKKEKGAILNEFCAVCGYSRKYAIRILNRQCEPRKKKPGPDLTYPKSIDEALFRVWKGLGCVGSRKLKAAMPLWLPYAYDLDGKTKQLLLSMSRSTIDRRLEKYRKQNLKGLTSTVGSLIKSKIPIRLLDEDVKEPGYIEADTVAHGGDSTAGSFVYTLTVTDLYSGWTETRAVWTKSADAVLEAFKQIEKELPFPVKRFACDNGTEFINEKLYKYFSERSVPVEFYRRRPYKKNDAAHVEQKNYTHVRKLFGYDRYDHKDLVVLMNEIYRTYWCPLQNMFIPCMKLKEKIRIGGKIKKKYDDPVTPRQRLIDFEDLPMKYKKVLHQRFEGRNPFYLKEEMDRKLKIFRRVVDIHTSSEKLVSL